MLGYGYIWIDSLCVIQNNADDFVLQCRSMGEIYTNAVVVISADAAQIVHTGFLHLRDHASVLVRIPLWKRGHHEQVDLRDRVFDDVDRVFAQPHVLGTTLDGHDSFYSNPVSARGWCFQEQLLASRVVHFTKHEIYWECGSCSTCECGQVGWEGFSGIPVLLSRYTNDLKRFPSGLVPSLSEFVFWWRIVEIYSNRKFTIFNAPS
ncbi:hypothetical protein F5Y12DRAFT_137021 [Xylaria sp. FL1777]|nr:hypothetical protein F5Y12DRAFT_137021 [Xylaria sp. FL1777]